jgi:crotonobetainyl-CoA:carnitine CoA-transferase CaiB-like acyl-CoA transferase
MGPGNADGFAALGVGTALLLGLVGHVRHGGGNVLRTSMLSTVALALADSNVDDGSSSGADVDPELLGVSAWHRLYPTADRWLMVAALSSDERDSLAAHTGVDLDDDECATALERFFAGASAHEHAEQLRAAGVTCIEVVDQAADRHVTLGAFGAEHGWVTTAQHPTLDEYPRVTAFTTFSRSRSVVGPAPVLGQQTDAILAEFARDAAKDAHVPSA